jgi:flavin reductase (DIM6/NTAB) family NADH-FMN oxidoreductase RutF
MKQVEVSEAWARKYPEPVVLVTSIKDDKPNIIPLGWSMITSFVPAMMAISIGHTRYSHELISKGREFALAYPGEDMGKEVLYCGTHSGRDVDKFKETNLKSMPAKKIKPPLLKDAVANFECKVVKQIDTGDHTIFVGEVVAAYVSPEKKRRLYTLDKNRTFGGLGQGR